MSTRSRGRTSATGTAADTEVKIMASVKRLYRSGKDKMLGGVCGGIAEYLNVDPTIVRFVWVLFTLAAGSGLLAYLIAWLIIPRNPAHKW